MLDPVVCGVKRLHTSVPIVGIVRIMKGSAKHSISECPDSLSHRIASLTLISDANPPEQNVGEPAQSFDN